MIHYKPVDLPERTVTVRTKCGTYVYLTQRVEYSSKLKCSRPKRIAIVRKTQLMDVLESVFPEQWEKILDLATYMMMTENTVMQYFEDYGYHHALFNESNFTDSTIGRLFDNMNIKDMDLFIRAWVKMHADTCR